jgi:SAM-dependent methyltransferase
MTASTAASPSGQAVTGKTFWEEVATTRWGAYVSEIETRAILEAQSLAGKPGQALEMGCEGGRWSKLLSDLGWQMTCVDINGETLSICQQKVPGAKCVLARPGDKTIPADANSVDLLLCIEVAPVIESGWFLGESARTLRAGGILVGVVLNRVSARAWMHARKNTIRGDGSDFYKTPYRNWREKLCQAGFQPVREEGFCWGPFGRTSNSPWIPLFTKVERLLGLHRLTWLSPWIVFIARKIPRGPAN